MTARKDEFLVRSSSWPKTPGSQPEDHRFESGTDYVERPFVSTANAVADRRFERVGIDGLPAGTPVARGFNSRPFHTGWSRS